MLHCKQDVRLRAELVSRRHRPFFVVDPSEHWSRAMNEEHPLPERGSSIPGDPGFDPFGEPQPGAPVDPTKPEPSPSTVPATDPPTSPQPSEPWPEPSIDPIEFPPEPETDPQREGAARRQPGVEGR